MTRIILLGQAIIDYICNENDNLIDIFDLSKNKFNIRNFQEIDNILDMAEITYKDIGGCITNTAINLNRLGRENYLAYTIGNDKRGYFYKSRITTYPKIKRLSTILNDNTGAVITFMENTDKNEPRTNVYNHGCANFLIFNHKLKDLINENSLTYISLFSFFEKDSTNIFEILSHAKKVGSQIIVDMGGIRNIDSEKLKEVIKYSNGLLVNNEEKASIEGKLNKGIEDISSNLWVIVKNASDPTQMYSNGKIIYSISPSSSPNIINCLGAGDAFAAGFINSISGKLDYSEAIHRGNCCARNIIEKKGCH